MGRPQDEMVAYYDRRAPEFDAWWEGTGPFEGRDRPGWNEELQALTRVVQALPPARVLDVGCGTGFVTRHLRGPLVVGLDTSFSMLRRAKERLPGGRLVRGAGSRLPFASGSFDRVFTSHVYGHVLPEDRAGFLAEAHRVGRQLVVVDAGPRGGGPRDEWQERRLGDGSRHRVYKRFFTARGLAHELGDGHVLHDGEWFVAVAHPAFRVLTVRLPASSRSPPCSLLLRAVNSSLMALKRIIHLGARAASRMIRAGLRE